ncbi:hsp90 co-chaperone Cdc37-like 1 [Corvus cornix cornix]|uniref:hsp90 co-chaperone Cdc37-like 1 n=1 Tax=Corvus cornix cornix TaxID=932674 RepID=UPI00194E7A1B|nr:hsp90 co-chaperone Cdc37-like 1 [Corvus cornix cornix]XP_048146862.1 hsp90 co-chaperone Cdc37-like 1 [Corvus hawaiiensis]
MALWLPRSHDGGAPEEEDDERAQAAAFRQRLPEVQTYSQGIELACQKEREFVKHSVECTWNLAEAQQKFGSLALHNSESCDQESAQARTEAAELRWREEEWRRKEEALNQRERQNLWNSDPVSKEVFNKSFINQKRKEIEDEAVSEPLMQKHEQKIRYFGMLSRWDDSQRFLSDHPYLVCEETSRYLMLWCFHLEAEQKRALMEQVAHQAVVMQFIIEIARSCNVDPRGCFRLFFQKAKTGEGYFEAFKNELEAFKTRVRIWSQSHGFQTMLLHDLNVNPGCMGEWTSFLQNTGDLQGSINTDVCSFNSVIQRDEEESKMMDTL